MQHRIAEKIGPAIDQAIEDHGQGENVAWEASLMPGQQGEALFVCFFWMPGAVLGSNMHGSFALHDPLNVTDEQIDKTVAEFLRQMREARSQQIAQQTPQGPAEPAMAGQRPSGLILP